MRALLLLSATVLCCLPFSSASPVPTISVHIDQSSQRVNASNANLSVRFSGSVSITKSAYLSATVTLAGTVDKGWAAKVEPATMTFTTSDPQPFTCSVDIPAATPGATDAQLSVEGTIQSGLLQSNDVATATISVVGTLPPPANQTGNGTGGTKPANGNNQTRIPTGLESTGVSAGFLGLRSDHWIVICAVAVVVAMAAMIATRARRRKRAVLTVDTDGTG